MLRRSCILFVCWCVLSCPAYAYERDVHYGLTLWLALKAGFLQHEAEAIARGNARVDSGGPTAIDPILGYACAFPDLAAALRVQLIHFPSSRAVPALPGERTVVAGSESAKRAASEAIKSSVGNEAEMLSLFGASLHPLQDSWSHRGIPDVPQFGGTLKCDPTLVGGHPLARGGANSHKANLTFAYPQDVLEMADATYTFLRQYPPIAGRKREPTAWPTLISDISAFAGARSKAEKSRWFQQQHFASTAFLDGISLPDGGQRSEPNLDYGVLPKLSIGSPRQYDAPQEQQTFFDALLAAWLLPTGSDQLLRPMITATSGRAEQVLARLRLLKLHDHGLSATALHGNKDLSRSDLRKLAQQTGTPRASINPANVADALMPLVAKAEEASLQLHYVLRPLSGGRVLAILRLKHLPYDTAGLIAEKTDTGWRLVDVVVAVDQ